MPRKELRNMKQYKQRARQSLGGLSCTFCRYLSLSHMYDRNSLPTKSNPLLLHSKPTPPPQRLPSKIQRKHPQNTPRRQAREQTRSSRDSQIQIHGSGKQHSSERECRAGEIVACEERSGVLGIDTSKYINSQ